MPERDLPILMEHLALRAELPLEVFCARFRLALNLPYFQFDCENETAWGQTVVDHVEYNVSKPYEEGTLQEWDETVPAGCNFGILLQLFAGHAHPTHEWAWEHLVKPIAQTVADEFCTTVYHHRTWLGVGKNVRREWRVEPRPGSRPRYVHVADHLPPPIILRGLTMNVIPPEAILRWANERLLAVREPELWLRKLAELPPVAGEILRHLEQYGAQEEVDEETRMVLLAYGFFRSRWPLADICSALVPCWVDLEDHPAPVQQVADLLQEVRDWEPETARRRCEETLEPYRATAEKVMDDFFTGPGK
jgi:hypothetical protein